MQERSARDIERETFLQRAEALRKEAPKPLPVEKVDLLLKGGDGSLAEEKNLVRLFLSSTFTDTQMERNFLMIEAYPFLRKLCMVLGLEFRVVDMRWGVRDERSDNHGASALCLREVEICKKKSISCAFVTLLGNKYGFRPFPSLIDRHEFETLRAHLPLNADSALLDQWFDLDMNNFPPRYVLRPILEVLPNYKDKKSDRAALWWHIFEKLQYSLRSAAVECRRLNLINEYDAEKYVHSITEDEVNNGIIWNRGAAHQTFFFDREYTNIDFKNPMEASKWIDIKDGKEDVEATTLLKKLKEKLHKHLPEPNKYKFTVDWPTRVTSVPDERLLHFVDEFCRKVAESTLTHFAALNYDYDLLIREVMYHYKIQQEKCESFIARPDMELKIREHINNNETNLPFVVYGESGCGKTCLMAKAAKDAKTEHPQAVVVYRFLGTTSESDDVRSLLYSISCHIHRVYGKSTAEVPKDYEALSKLECLKLATPQHPLILFLDSLDQLFTDKQTSDMSWVPINLPPNVHVVLSTLIEIGDCFKALKARIPDANHFVEISKLDDEYLKKLLIALLRNNERTLTQEQQDEIYKHAKQCPLPLYIRLATDICYDLRSSQKLPEIFPIKLKGLINKMLDNLEHDHGKIVISHALSYITCARNGLTLNELEDILSCDDEVIDDVYQWWIPPERRMPPLLWLRIRNDLWRYLIERGNDGYITYAWYHRQWPDVITKRYLENDPKLLQHIHRSLAEYFTGKWANGKPYWDRSEKVEKKANRLVDPQSLYLAGNLPNLRKLSELPYHQLQCRNFVEMAENSLGSLQFISAKIEANKLYELMEDFILAESKLAVSDTDSLLGMLEVWDYHRFVRANMHILSKDPSALLQQALNFPDGSVISREAENVVQMYKPNRMFVRWHNKNPFIDPCIMKIEVPKPPYKYVHQMVASPDGSRVFSMLNNGELRLWSLRTGSLVFTIPPHSSHSGKNYKHADCYAVFSYNGEHMYYFAPSQNVQEFNSSTGHLHHRLDSLLNLIRPSVDKVVVVCAASCPIGKSIAICAQFIDKRIDFFKVIICDFRLRKYKVASSCSGEKVIAMHYIEENILLNRYRNEVTIVNLDNDIFATKRFKSVIISTAISLDKQHLAISTENSVRIVDVNSFKTVWKVKHKDDVRCIFHKNSPQLLVWGNGKLESLNLNNMEEGLQLASTDFPETDHIYWAQDNKLILTGYYKDKITGFKVWDYNSQALRKVGKNAVCLSDNQIVVISENSEIAHICNITEYPPKVEKEHNIETQVWRIFVSPDSSFLACDSIDSGFKIYHIPSFNLVMTREGKFLCFSPSNHTICYEKRVKNRVIEAEHVIVMERIRKSPNIPCLVLRLSGDTLKETFSRVKAACYSHDEKHLLYSTSTGAAMYHFDKRETTILKFPWAPYQASADFYNKDYTSSDNATFSPDDSHFVVSLTSNKEEFTVIYAMQDFKIMQVLPGTSKAISFVPDQPHVFIRLTNNTTEWWNLEGRLLHRFYTLGVPMSLSTCSDAKRTHKAIITDEQGYAYILSPHNPSLLHPEELKVDGVMSGVSFDIRLRDRPLASDAASFFWETREYHSADYKFFWKYMFPGDRGRAFKVTFPEKQEYELKEDITDITIRHMQEFVDELQTEIRKVNHAKLGHASSTSSLLLSVSFSEFAQKYPTVAFDVERVFMKFTDMVNLQVAKETADGVGKF